MSTVTHHIALIPGDGIGIEVLPAAMQVLETVGRRHDLGFEWTDYDWGCDRYLTDGAMMPPDGLDRLAGHDAILLGAVGRPDVPDHVSLWGLLIPIRRHFHQYVNLRPITLLHGLTSPLRTAASQNIDLVIVRENNEGEYSKIGGRIYEGTPEEIVLQQTVFTRRGVSRILNYAFDLATRRRGQLTSATKSNGIVHTMPFWDQVVTETAAVHPDVTVQSVHIDALAAAFVLHPERFDVVVGSNLFGDILSDLGAAIVSSIGLAPSANLNPEGDHPSMFEPVHGSAPDIAGQGIANPIGAIWSAGMMLDHLGHTMAASEVMASVQSVLVDGVRTPDLGGEASTTDVADAVSESLGTNGGS